MHYTEVYSYIAKRGGNPFKGFGHIHDLIHCVFNLGLDVNSEVCVEAITDYFNDDIDFARTRAAHKVEGVTLDFHKVIMGWTNYLNIGHDLGTIEVGCSIYKVREILSDTEMQSMYLQDIHDFEN
jgi:hypothetical protein